ncbi:GNAT family N-acetyltransferase [Erythrobacter sp. W53]|uniref:GNAT family N-acetyltransferase n=1 Tax=Erythrobacter sp. W53 TaxID=3425947 RepID=UPI003D768C82
MTDTPVLKTARFTMRPLQCSDCAALFPTLSNEIQCRYLTRPAFASEEELWGWLADPDWNGRTWIAEDADGHVAGRFVAMPGHDDCVSEIGYIVCADRQGQGVAGECTAALVDYLFNQDGQRKLTAEVDIDNTASIKLLERLGFAREAHLREHEVTHIGLRDVLLYGLLFSDKR